MNKTTLSARTNRIIGGRAPSEYLATLQRQAGIDDTRMDAILASHVMKPETLRTDDFDAFFAARAEALLQRIEDAIGKKIPRSQPDEAGAIDANAEKSSGREDDQGA